jgi:hypothetical protein
MDAMQQDVETRRNHPQRTRPTTTAQIHLRPRALCPRFTTIVRRPSAGTIDNVSGFGRSRRMQRLILVLIGCCLLTGCIVVPLPHVTESSPSIKGRIIDAMTSQPIKNAVVQLENRQAQDKRHASIHDRPQDGATTKTRADGRFSLGPRYNFHLLWYCNPSFQFHLPNGTYWLGELSVTHPDYERFSASSFTNRSDLWLKRTVAQPR